MNRIEQFFQDKRVLVTGHTGFQGSWLVLWLTELGAQVHGYGLEPATQPNLFAESGAEERLTSHTIGDVRDFAALRQVVRDVRPELVFHLASQPLLRRSYQQPRETFEINCVGTVNLLEAIRKEGGVRVCQVVTSDRCYQGVDQLHAFREDDPLGGSDPYAGSKACAELAVAAYRQSFFPPAQAAKHGVSVATVRACNLIGGGDWSDERLFPDCIRALVKHQPIVVRNPHAVRPLQHVLEPLAGCLQLALAQWYEPAGFADAWNFGPLPVGHWPIRAVVEEVIRCWKEGSWTLDAPSLTPDRLMPPESHAAKLDITKAVTLLGWQPVYTIEQAVQETVGWYRRRNSQGAVFQAAAACLEQIRTYSAFASQAGLKWAEAIPANREALVTAK